MNPTVALSSSSAFKKAGVKETAVLLALAWFIPFAVHLAPWSGPRPLGAYLIPIFWATFVAVYFYGTVIGLLVGLFSPILNLLVTGFPAWKFQAVMSVELIVYVLIATWAVKAWPRFFLIAPLGYLVAKVASTGLQAAVSTFGDIGPVGDYYLRSLMGSLPGLVVLAAINVALVWFYPRPARRT